MDCLEQALRAYEAPEIFNSDQVCQFTADAFTEVLKDHGMVVQHFFCKKSLGASLGMGYQGLIFR